MLLHQNLFQTFFTLQFLRDFLFEIKSIVHYIQPNLWNIFIQ